MYVSWTVWRACYTLQYLYMYKIYRKKMHKSSDYLLFIYLILQFIHLGGFPIF